MTNEGRRRLIKKIREHLDCAHQGQMPTAQLAVAVTLLTQIVEDVARQVETGAKGDSNGEE